jgi:hypothetical protein
MKRNYLLYLMLLFSAILNAQYLVEVPISSDYNDMEEYVEAGEGETQDSIVGELDFASNYIELGYKDDDGVTPQLCGFRFEDINIGQGRVISNAYIEFTINTDAWVDACSFYIYGEDASDSEVFATSQMGPPGVSLDPEYESYELSSRTMLEDSVYWAISSGEAATIDGTFQTSDITSLVQQIVDREDWDSTSVMSLYIKGDMGAREVYAYESDESKAATLYISYELSEADKLKIREDSIQALADSLLEVSIDSVLVLKTGVLNEEDYTIPTWTLLKRGEETFSSDFNYDTESITELVEAVDSLQSSAMPYNVCMTINGNPETQMGFTWFTNYGKEAGEVQIVEGEVTNPNAFDSYQYSFIADTTNIIDLPYCTSDNELDDLAGFEDSETRSYTTHKALATGLTANTIYSYRVGKDGAWSPIGTFTTGERNGETLRFMYLADTQAMNDEYFEASKNTALTAYDCIPDAQFCLMTGDLVESKGSSNSEWEWEQWFELMQPVWKNVPIAPVVGNHDISTNKNFTYHFNTDSVGFDHELSTSPGGVYSFVQGDALFIAMSTEDYDTEGFLDSLKQYIYDEVEANQDVRWKFAFYHKTIYTGSSSHQSDADSRTVREAMIPVFDSCGIDLAFQGHDHIYEVIGATRDYQLVDGAVIAVDSTSEESGVRSNMNGRNGGVFDVTNGTLFFLNCSAGLKKYSPRTEDEMVAAEDDTGIANYWGLFTGKFGQPDLPTFSDVVVTYDTVTITTYTVDDEIIEEYDSFQVVKDSDDNDEADEKSDSNDITTNIEEEELTEFSIWPNPVSHVLNIAGVETIDNVSVYSLTGKLLKTGGNTSTSDISDLPSGVYFVKVKSGSNLFIEQFLVKK